METLTTYFIPLVLAYGIPCGLWFLMDNYMPSVWPKPIMKKPDKAWLELLLGFAAVFGIVLIGQLWRMGWLLPGDKENTVVSTLLWWLNNLIIFSPIFLVIMLRKQSLNTVFLNGHRLVLKISFGIIASAIGVEIYMLFNEAHADNVFRAMLEPTNIRNFVPVFLEGVGLAFLFVRLKWVVGLMWAILIPAILFALVHIPRAMANGTSIEMTIIDSLLTALITALVFSTTAKSRDVIWLGLLHYFLDIAIGAFN